MKKYLLLLLVSTIACGSSYADVYKWIDENGKAHYSDTNPATVSGDKVKTIEVKPVNTIETNEREEKYTAEFLREKEKQRAEEKTQRDREAYAQRQAEQRELELEQLKKAKVLEHHRKKKNKTPHPVGVTNQL